MTTTVRPYRELLPSGEMRQSHVLDRYGMPEWKVRPPFTLMNGVFGEQGLTDYPELYPWYETPPYLEEREDGHGILWGITQVMRSARLLQPRHIYVLIARYGLNGKEPKLLSEVGTELGVTHERIRQLENKALRTIRHPSHSGILRTFIRHRSHADMRAASARKELYGILAESKSLSFRLAGQIVLRLKRDQLRSAFQAVNRGDLRLLNKAVANSCSLQLGECQMCGEPAIPNSDWCLLHLSMRSRIIMTCDGCGIRFPRLGGTLVSYSRLHGHTQNHLFHDRGCLFANARRLGGYHRTKHP